MRHESADELFRSEHHGPELRNTVLSRAPVVLVFDGDSGIPGSEIFYPAVGYCRAVRVAPDVFHEVLRAGERLLAEDYPVGRDRRRRDQVPLEGGLEPLQERLLEFHRELLDVEQIFTAGMDPAPPVGAQTSARDYAVDVRMEAHVRAPCVEHRHHGRRCAVFVAEKSEQAFGHRGEEDIVEFLRVAMDEAVQGCRDGEYQMEIRHRKQFGLPLLHPYEGVYPLALRTVPVAAGVVRYLAVPAVAAVLHMPPEDIRPARGHSPQNTPLHSRESMRPLVVLPEAPEYLTDIELSPRRQIATSC